MKKRVVVAIVVASVTVTTANASASPKSFSVTAKRTSSHTTKTASSFTESLLNGKKVVGKDSVQCKATKSVTSCTGTFTFTAGGTISIDSALVADGNNATFKLTGGTGPYAGAAGTLKLTTLSGTTTKLTFTFS